MMQAAPLKFSSEERAAHGFADGLIRISVELEDYDDLRDDLIGSIDRLK